MTPDELLRLYPRETLRWLRRRLGLSQRALAEALGVAPSTVEYWERGQTTLRQVRPRRRVTALLAPHLATPAGAAFVRSLGRGESMDGSCAPLW